MRDIIVIEETPIRTRDLDRFVIVPVEAPFMNAMTSVSFADEKLAEEFLNKHLDQFSNCKVCSVIEQSKKYYKRFPHRLFVVEIHDMVELFNGTKGEISSIDKSNYTFTLGGTINFSLMDIKYLNGININNHQYLLKFK